MRELGQMFYDPAKVYAAIRERKLWLPGFVAVVLMTVLSAVLVIQLVGMQTITRKRLEASPRVVAQLGQEKIDERVANSDTPGQKAVAYVGAAVVSCFYLLVAAGVFLGLLNLMEAGLSFKQSLGTFAYSVFPFSVAAAVMTGLILAFSSDRAELNLENLIPLNPGAFLDAAAIGKPLYSLASSMDLLSFAQLGMLGFGYSQVSGKSFAKCLGIAVALWAVYVLCKTGLSALF